MSVKTELASNIELVLPLEKRYAHVLRLTVAGISSRLKFSWDQVEEIKLAVEEAFLLVLSANKSSEIHFNFVANADYIEINVLNADLGRFNINSYEQKYSFFIMTGLVDNVDIIPLDEKNLFNIKLQKRLY